MAEQDEYRIILDFKKYDFEIDVYRELKIKLTEIFNIVCSPSNFLENIEQKLASKINRVHNTESIESGFVTYKRYTNPSSKDELPDKIYFELQVFVNDGFPSKLIEYLTQYFAPYPIILSKVVEN